MGRLPSPATADCAGQRSVLVQLFADLVGADAARTAANQLWDELGSLPAILAAGEPRHVAILGNPALARHLRNVRAVLLETLRVQAYELPILTDLTRLTTYLMADMSHERHECVRILYLNARNALIRDETVARGGALSAALSVREVMRRAIEVGATGIIIVHNHPSGNPNASASDVSLTKNLIAAGGALEITVHDHLIVGRDSWVSMRVEGLL